MTQPLRDTTSLADASSGRRRSLAAGGFSPPLPPPSPGSVPGPVQLLLRRGETGRSENPWGETAGRTGSGTAEEPIDLTDDEPTGTEQSQTNGVQAQQTVQQQAPSNPASIALPVLNPHATEAEVREHVKILKGMLNRGDLKK